MTNFMIQRITRLDKLPAEKGGVSPGEMNILPYKYFVLETWQPETLEMAKISFLVLYFDKSSRIVNFFNVYCYVINT